MKKSPPAAKLPKKRIVTEPIHQQIAQLCREAFQRGAFSVGDRFPSERELAKEYGVSRATANKVVSILIAENLLELEKGIGTRVARQTTLYASLREMESFTEHARGQGMTPKTRVLKFEKMAVGDLPETVCHGLELTRVAQASVTYLERLRLADGVPMILEHRWVNDSVVPGMQRKDLEGSFYHLLEEKYDLPMTGEKHKISAVNLGGESAGLLETKRGAAALLVEGSGYVRKGEPVWYQQLYYRGDRYEFHNETRGTSTPAAFQLRMMGN